MTPTPDELRRHLPAWRQATLVIGELSGGITNRNYRVEVDGVPHVLRVAGQDTELLGIDRAAEALHTAAAAELGLGPRLLAQVASRGWMVLEFLPGRTQTPEDLNGPGAPRRLGQVIRRLHQAQGFVRPFEMLRWWDRYREQLIEWRVPSPPEFATLATAIEAIRDLFARWPVPLAPCHNDLLAGNLLVDGDVWRIVDFEYSGFNDPFFELGNTAQEQEYGPEALVELCSGYFGAATEPRLARTWLNMIVSDAGWSLWAAIQARISRLEFDFASYGQSRWNRALAKASGPDFARHLRQANADPQLAPQ